MSPLLDETRLPISLIKSLLLLLLLLLLPLMVLYCIVLNLRLLAEAAGLIICKYPWAETQGGLGGRSPQNLRWGRPMHPSPNIWRSSVIGCAAKYELTKKGVMKECFVLKQRFFVKKRVIYVYISDFRQQRQAKDRQNTVDD